MKKDNIKTLLIISALLMPLISYASVRSVSKTQTVTADDGQTYKQITVTCKNFNGARILRKPASGGRWCDSVLTDYCAGQPLKAGEKVCSRRYEDAMAEVESSSAADEPVAHEPAPNAEQEPTLSAQERQQLEEERRLIEQKRTELRKKEQELLERKRAIEDS